jgi:small nuclear ribonucleoprotein (snRNP)-like protein
MESKNNFLNKLVKIVSHDDRVIIGKLKCIDNNCTLYLTEVVEAFGKQSDHCVNIGLFKNNEENFFGFESQINYYQVYSPCIVPKEQIKNIIMLKE